MKITHTALAAMGFMLLATEVSVAQSSFDCRRPRSEAVATICATPHLAQKDREVDAAYTRALDSADEPNRVRDNHTAWANSLSICGADRQCLAELLDEELEALEYASRPKQEAERLSVPEPEPELALPPSPAPIQSIEEPPTEPTFDLAPVKRRPASDSYENSFELASPIPVEGSEPAPAKRKVPEWEKAAFGGLLLIPLLGIIAGLLATKSLAEHTSRRYQWPLILNWWNVTYLVGIFGGLFVSTMGVPASGLVFFGATCLVMLVVNVSKTNLLTGLAMTLVQPFVVVILWLAYGIAKANVQGRRT